MLPTALQASLTVAGAISSQPDDSLTKNTLAECEKLIEEISSSIKDSQISNAFESAARSKLPA
jgi:hypothetical protein